jgi:N-acetylglucosaminyl-diphospho-decaprenol L-rhamnosyltransferase
MLNTRPIRTVCVIVNYNDADNTIRLLDRIRNYKSLDAIILVDNHSTDASFVRLRACVRDHVILLQAEKNGGYGSGNNLGIRYAHEMLRAKYALIANPDTEFSDTCISEMVKVMENHPELGVIAPVKTLPDRGEELSIPGSRANVLAGAAAWPIRPWLYDLLESGPVSRRIFTPLLHYGASRFRGKTCVYVDSVPGSLLLTDISKFLASGAYDEDIFLYAEEYTLAWNMKACGYRTALLLRESYVHRHSRTIRKNISEPIRRQKLREKSALHYYEYYLGITDFQILLTRLFYFAVNLEVLIWGRMT